jgi:hypothetical protein
MEGGSIEFSLTLVAEIEVYQLIRLDVAYSLASM